MVQDNRNAQIPMVVRAPVSLHGRSIVAKHNSYLAHNNVISELNLCQQQRSAMGHVCLGAYSLQWAPAISVPTVAFLLVSHLGTGKQAR